MKNTFLFLVFISLVIVIASILYKSTLDKREIVVLKDSIHTQHLKYNETVYSKKTLEVEFKDLKTINDSLYYQIKQLKETPLIVEVTKLEYKQDSIITSVKLDTVSTPEYTQYTVNWSYKENKDNLNIVGNTTLKFDNNHNIESYKTIINDISLDIELVGGLTKNKSGYNYHVISNSKNVNISRIDGYVMNSFKPKPKKFGVSIFGGPVYDCTNKNIGIGIGIGISYNIIQLF